MQPLFQKASGLTVPLFLRRLKEARKETRE
jgi:hypothetical protein